MARSQTEPRSRSRVACPRRRVRVALAGSEAMGRCHGPCRHDAPALASFTCVTCMHACVAAVGGSARLGAWGQLNFMIAGRHYYTIPRRETATGVLVAGADHACYSTCLPSIGRSVAPSRRTNPRSASNVTR